jgi:cellulose synthase/poly-beta-1,6-N-acetylglucosamine synthase-like glycosyltransferase
MTPPEAVFWVATFLLAYTYVGYPVLVWMRSRLAPRPAWPPGDRLPSITLLTVAQDEGDQIERRIDNLLALDYPRYLVDIMVASDGSDDDTVRRACARARTHGRGRVTVVAFPERRGKAATLCDAVHGARGEILVLCDTRQHIATDALRALVAPFADPAVGAVSGTLALLSGGGAVGRGIGAYWRYETFLRSCESRIDSMLGATGALYAMRRELFERVPPDTLDDDLVLPCRALRRGYRTVFEPQARAIDEAPVDRRSEFGRKVRTLAGCFQLFTRERWLLDPRRNRIWWQTVSHKGLRLLGPFFLLAMLVASVLLWAEPFYRFAVAGQLGLYAAAVVGGAAAGRSRLLKPLALAHTFCLLQVAVLVGFVRYLSGSQPVTWKSIGRIESSR